MKKFLSALMILGLGFAARAATLTNLNPVSITATTATLQATVININSQLPYVRFVWGRQSQTNYDDWANKVLIPGRVSGLNSSITYAVTGLTPNNGWFFSSQSSEDNTNWVWAVSNSPTAFSTLPLVRFPLPSTVTMKMGTNLWLAASGTNLLWIVGNLTNQVLVMPLP